MIYTRYMMTPAVRFIDGEVVLKGSREDVEEAMDIEDHTVAVSVLLGFDPESKKWEVLVTEHQPTTLVRKVRMMFGIKIEWDGDAPFEFNRGDGIVARQYTTYKGRRARVWGGLMTGSFDAYEGQEADWLRFEEIARRLGVTVTHREW